MIQIAISQAAFEAIAATLSLGSVSYEDKTNEQGERLIWLDGAMVDRLRVRLAKETTPTKRAKR
jgi:hypothetical protein